MKGTTPGGMAVAALIALSSALAQTPPAAASAPSLLARPIAPAVHAAQPALSHPHRSDGIRFETERHHAPGDEITLGGNYYGPIGDPAPTEPPLVVVAPVYGPFASPPIDTPSHGPRIIYIGKETERQRTAVVPRVIYGDTPARFEGGPSVIYGEPIR